MNERWIYPRERTFVHRLLIFPLLDYVDHLLPLEQPPYVLKQFKCSPLFIDFFLFIFFIYIFHDFYFIFCLFF